MALTTLIPEATLTYYHPAAGGMVTEFGYSRDWRPNRLWQGRGVEYIDPLQAIAPAGAIYPRNMTIAEWTVTNNAAYGEWYADTYPAVRGLLFRDGRVYASGTPITTFIGTLSSASTSLPPNLVLHTIRAVPPPGQGVLPQVNLELQGLYWNGTDWNNEARLTLVIPKHNDEYRTPFLHVYVGAWTDSVNFFAAGEVVSHGPASSSAGQGGVARESWVIETVEIWQDQNGALYGEEAEGREFVRAHVLIRNLQDMSAWWHWSSDRFRCLQAGQWRINVGGQITWLNIVPLVYGSTPGYCWPPHALPLPQVAGSAWAENAAPWGGIQTAVSDWSTVVSAPTGTPPGIDHRPQVTFTRTSASGMHKRPVAWLVYEEHPATIEVPEGLHQPQTTQGTTLLRSVEYELNNRWKGATGTAEFYANGTTDIFPDWRENGIVELTVGLAPVGGASAGEGLDPAQIATAYILPDGLQRRRVGAENSGGYQLSIAFGDYAAARIRQKAIVDFRQAALRTVEDWAISLAQRIGIPQTAVTVDSSVASKVIPFHELPSLPNLAPQDGDDWLAHIEAVERACGIRVCFDKFGTGGMQVDTGPPKYVQGTSVIAFTLDDTSVSIEDQIETIELDREGGRFKNFLKVLYGPPEHQQSYYYVEPTATRVAGIGDDWAEAIAAEHNPSADSIVDEFMRERYRWSTALRWTGPLRRHLRPDQFVQINVDGLGVERGTVMQIVTHRVELDKDAMAARSVCLCTNVVAEA